jgi:2-polyprenyl-3-methyl-5-hydroxy-6-metoxy-1,4-benzoquinol methylase
MNIEGLEVNSPKYWDIRHSRDNWNRWSKWALSLVFEDVPKGSDVVIVGCGQGMEAIKLLEYRPDINSIMAFDVSKSAIEKANVKPHGDKITFRCIDLFKSSEIIPMETFDYLITIQNFEHWRPDMHYLAMKKCWRMIKHGGRMFFTGVGSSWDLSQMNFSKMDFNGKEVEIPNDYHYVNWTEQQVYNLLMAVSAQSVRFFRKRGRDRVIAVGYK